LPSLTVPVGLSDMVTLVPIGGSFVSIRVDRILVPISQTHGVGDGGVIVAILSVTSILVWSWTRLPRIVGVVVSPKWSRSTCPIELVSDLLLIGFPERWRLTEVIH
jgi:Mg2+/Co2+ transporter CorB